MTHLSLEQLSMISGGGKDACAPKKDDCKPAPAPASGGGGCCS